ncbi:MAG: cytochrome c [Bdellovibrionales bacterium]|nr:cytochrome c [Bdellovibrionales bacterium]
MSASSYLRKILVVTILLSFTGCSGTQDVPSPHPSDPRYVERGRELVNGLAACGRCHGERPEPRSVLSGGRELQDIYGSVPAPNITAAELSGWTFSDLAKLFRTFERPDGEAVAVEHHLGFQWLSENDLYSIAAYVKSLPPVKNSVERRTLSTLSSYTTGMLEKRPSVDGYVPEIPTREQTAYGKYLVDTVARCGSCHNTESTLFSSTKYLKGGREILSSEGSAEALAPNITSSKTFGIGEWSEAQIVRYLQSGITAENRSLGSQFCPTNFYQQAKVSDLEAIAHYLLTVEG